MKRNSAVGRSVYDGCTYCEMKVYVVWMYLVEMDNEVYSICHSKTFSF